MYGEAMNNNNNAATASRKVTQEGHIYKTRKGAQNYIDGFLAEEDLGWFVIEVTRRHFVIVRPMIPGDEERGDRVYTLPA